MHKVSTTRQSETETLGYIAAMLVEMRNMVSPGKHDALIYFIELTRMEAIETIERGSPLSGGGKKRNAVR
jgi:hypothetical protein